MLGVGDDVRVRDDAAVADAEPEPVGERVGTGESELDADEVAEGGREPVRVAGAVAVTLAGAVLVGVTVAGSVPGADATAEREAVLDALDALLALVLADSERDDDAELLDAADDDGCGELDADAVLPLLRVTEGEPLGVLVDDAVGVATLVADLTREAVEQALTVGEAVGDARALTVAAALCDAVAVALATPLDDSELEGERVADAERELADVAELLSEADAVEDVDRDRNAEAE